MSMLDAPGSPGNPSVTAQRGSGLRIWTNTIGATIVVGSELVAVAIAFSWALAGLLDLSRVATLIMDGLALAAAAAVIVAFARRAYDSESQLDK